MNISLRLVLLFGIVVFSFSGLAQENDQKAIMETWQKYMTPGPEHKMLGEMVGEWEGDIKMWMDPSQPPQSYKGTVTYESIFDGRYIVGKYSGIMMGMPFNGMDITGFDNAKKMFFNVWIDNMGTGIMNLEGTYDKDSKTYSYTGQMTDPMGNNVKVREVITVIDKDHSKFEMYSDMGKGETKSMEINYTRKL